MDFFFSREKSKKNKNIFYLLFYKYFYTNYFEFTCKIKQTQIMKM